MKPSLTFKVSGIFALLVTATFTIPTPRALAFRADGYTANGQPYYYAYPDEGYADEESVDENSIPAQSPSDYPTAQPDDYNSDASNIDPYYDWSGTGWYYPFGGPGVPFGQHNIFSRPPRQGFFGSHGMHDGMRHNFHSPTVTPHHNLGGKTVVGTGRVMGNGAVHSGGSIHASGGMRGGGGGHR